MTPGTGQLHYPGGEHFTLSEADDRRHVVAERWADREFKTGLDAAHWMASATVCAYLNWLASGQADCDWLTYLLSRWFPPKPARVLVLGCGDGWLERTIAGVDWITRIDAFDVAAEAVARADETARAQGIDKIHYEVRDLNVEEIGEGPFDLVIAHSVIHHIENLEFFFDQLERALAEDGVLVVNEYVGPKRFQFTDRQLEIENAILSLLPERFRAGHLQAGIWNEKPRPSVEQMIRIDPSEAVRSDEITAFLERRFSVLESREYGGTILHDLLYDLVPNFDEDKPDERALLVAMCLAEGVMIRRGVLPSDFVVMTLARKPRTALNPELVARAFVTDGTVDWTPASPMRISFQGRSPSVLDRPWNRPGPARRAENLLASGRSDRDWVEAALLEAGMPASAVVDGEDVDSVSKRLESLGVDVRTSGVERLVVGSRLFSRGPGPVLACMAPDGIAVSVEDFRVGRELPDWSDEVTRLLLGLLPDNWKEPLTVSQILRDGLVTRDKPRRGWPDLEAELGSAGLSAECRPMSTLWISRLLSSAPLHRFPKDESAVTLLSILAWLDGHLASEGLLSANRGLVIARRIAPELPT